MDDCADVVNSSSANHEIAADARWVWMPGPTGPNRYVEFRCEFERD